jgi:quercetin dioxygenase-like cupin family protein
MTEAPAGRYRIRRSGVSAAVNHQQRTEGMKMKTMIAAVALTFIGAAPTIAQNISQNGSRPSAKGPAAYFTGIAIVDPLFAANPHMAATGGHVTFEPGARSAWHTHPAGQVLIVTSGTGWTQEEGGEKRVIKPGDVIWCPPGVKHWHGATATTSMGHIAITNMVDGKNVEWMEKVSDDQYAK